MTQFPGSEATSGLAGQPWTVLALSALLSCSLTPLVILVAQRMGWLAHPRSDRWATRTVALMGGIAIVSTFLLMLVITGAWLHGGLAPALGAGVVILAVLGAIDDRGGVNPGPKLMLELAVAIVLLAMGVRFGPSLPLVLSVPCTVLWIIGVTNAMNLLDNMDGLAAGTGVVIGAGCGALGLVVHDGALAALSFMLAGACLGYLPYNYRHARVFMGDTGSLPLGLVVATLSLLAGERTAAFTGSSMWGVAVPVLLCALPIVDTTLVTISRLRTGRAVSQGGRDHSSHRLVYAGLSDTGAVMALQLGALVLVAVAVQGTRGAVPLVPLAVSGIASAALVLAWLLRIDPYAAAARAAAAKSAMVVAHIQPVGVRQPDGAPLAPPAMEPGESDAAPRPVLVRRAN